VTSSRGCPQQVVRVVLVDFGERHDTRGQTGSTTPQQTAGRPIRSARGRGSRQTRPTRTTCYGHLARMSRGCYAENGPVECVLCRAGQKGSCRAPITARSLDQMSNQKLRKIFFMLNITTTIHRCKLARDSIGYLQLSILMGQTWTSSGYFCSFIGHERTADILHSQPLYQTTAYLSSTMRLQARRNGRVPYFEFIMPCLW